MPVIEKYKGFASAFVVGIVAVVFCWYAITEAYKIADAGVQSRFEKDAALLRNKVQYSLQNFTDVNSRLGLMDRGLAQMTKGQYLAFLNPQNDALSSERNMAVSAEKLSGDSLRLYAKSYEKETGSPFTLYAFDGMNLTPIDVDYAKTYYLVTHQIMQNIQFSELINVDLGSFGELRPYLEKIERSRQTVVVPFISNFGDYNLGSDVFIVFSSQEPAVSGEKAIDTAGGNKSSTSDTSKFVGSLIFLNDLKEKLLLEEGFTGLNLTIETGGAVAGPPSYEHRTFKDQVKIGGRTWPLTIISTPFAYKTDLSTAIYTTIITLFLAGMMIYFVIQQAKRSGRIETLISKRTAALRKAHEELENHYLTLQKLNNELDDARLRAEQASKAKSEFLATMSHELRTPLNSILGFSQIIRDQSLGDINEPRYVEYADNIHQSGDHLLAMINDILDLAKLEAGRLDMKPIFVSLQTLIERTAAIFKPMAEEKSLVVTVTVDEDLPPYIYADEKRLKQLLINLLGNAVKFTHEGTISLVVRKHESQAGRDYWQFEVSDTGIGISNDIKHTLFDRFSQVDHGVAREYGGTGLGLAICHELVQKMSGYISVESTLGEGSTFRVVLPLEEAQAADDDSDLI